MSNSNQMNVNVGNIQIQPNSMNSINQMNIAFYNTNLANMNIQSANFLFNELMLSIDKLDILNFQNILTKQQFPIQTKNILLNKCMLLYLSHFNQKTAQNALKQMITLLLKLKANPNLCLRYMNGQNSMNNTNNYAIFPIVEKNDIELVKIFLDNNAEINVLDYQGRNCLFYLMTVPNTKNNLIDKRPLCSLLLGKGIKINCMDVNGLTPMMESINKGYIYIMSMLIKYGGDVNLQNSIDGNTALHYAIMNKNIEALYIILGKGNCDISIQNFNKETAVDIAKKMDSETTKEICDIIMQFTGKNFIEEDNKENGNNKKEKKLDNETMSTCSTSDGGGIFNFLNFDKSRIEIDFDFQKNKPILNSNNDNDSISSNNTGNNNANESNQFHSFIKITKTPVLYLDISDEVREDKLMCESLKSENENLEITLENKETKLQKYKNENENLKKELMKLKNEFLQKNSQMKTLSEEIKKEENEHIQQRQIRQKQIEQKDMSIQSHLIKLKNLENELNNKNKETQINQNESKTEGEIDENNTSDKDNELKIKYLERKFNNQNFKDSEVVNLLTTDLYDFYHYNKIIYDNRIQEINKMINILKELIEINVDVKLYGSYATQTSLSWSEVDILIIPNENPNYSNENFYINFIQSFFHKLKSTFFQKVYILENTHYISPIIKIDTSEQNINLIYNIYVLEANYIEDIKNLNDNRLLNSVIMTNEYNEKYKGKFIPILLGLKQLLYTANLINNYYNNHSEINITYNDGISSYALSVMLMSFLDEYKNYAIDIPIGQIFVDFLRVHGYLMHENNNRKIIYISYNNNGQNEENEEIKFIKENGNIDSLYIIDPFSIKNNLCEKMYAYSKIKLALKIAFCVLKDNCECSCHYNDKIKYQGKTHCILNKVFKTVKRFTNKKKNQ